jgi:hypothetical protein
MFQKHELEIASYGTPCISFRLSLAPLLSRSLPCITFLLSFLSLSVSPFEADIICFCHRHIFADIWNSHAGLNVG